MAQEQEKGCQSERGDQVSSSDAGLLHAQAKRCASEWRLADNRCVVATFDKCAIYSITTNQEAIRALFRVVNRYVGNLAPTPGVFPDYPAPVVRNAATERELVCLNVSIFRSSCHSSMS